MKTISFDISSGDGGYKVALESAIRFANNFQDWKLILFATNKEIIDLTKLPKNIEIKKFESIVDNNKSIIESIRDEKTTLYNSIMSVVNGESMGIVSAGSSSVLTTIGFMKFKAINEKVKIAFAPIFVDFQGKKKIMLDAGANMSYDSNVLETYAIMGGEMAKVLKISQQPKIALLNNGIENNKGDHLRLETYKNFSTNKNINFIGNVEADHLFISEFDVIVSDAFSGNIMLKSIEGVYRKIISILRKNKKTLRGKIAFLLTKKTMVADFKKIINAEESGGAIVLGLNNIVVKAHGGSDSREYYNSLIVAKNCIEFKLVDNLKEMLSKYGEDHREDK